MRYDLGDYASHFLDYGFETLEDLCNPSLITDDELEEEIGMTARDISRFHQARRDLAQLESQLIEMRDSTSHSSSCVDTPHSPYIYGSPPSLQQRSQQELTVSSASSTESVIMQQDIDHGSDRGSSVHNHHIEYEALTPTELSAEDGSPTRAGHNHSGVFRSLRKTAAATTGTHT